MSVPYEKNQKDRVPFETYKARFAQADRKPCLRQAAFLMMRQMGPFRSL